VSTLHENFLLNLYYKLKYYIPITAVKQHLYYKCVKVHHNQIYRILDLEGILYNLFVRQLYILTKNAQYVCCVYLFLQFFNFFVPNKTRQLIAMKK